MFTLIRGATVYSPEKTGVRDILVAGSTIAAILESLDVPGLPNLMEIEARGRLMVQDGKVSATGTFESWEVSTCDL